MNTEKEIQNLKKQNKGLMIAVGVLILIQLGSFMFNDEPQDAESMIQEMLEEMGEDETISDAGSAIQEEPEEIINYVTEEECFQVQIGMNMDQVREVLGEPHETSRRVGRLDTSDFWRYEINESYDQCMIMFVNGLVASIS